MTKSANLVCALCCICHPIIFGKGTANLHHFTTKPQFEQRVCDEASSLRNLHDFPFNECFFQFHQIRSASQVKTAGHLGFAKIIVMTMTNGPEEIQLISWEGRCLLNKQRNYLLQSGLKTFFNRLRCNLIVRHNQHVPCQLLHVGGIIIDGCAYTYC